MLCTQTVRQYVRSTHTDTVPPGIRKKTVKCEGNARIIRSKRIVAYAHPATDPLLSYGLPMPSYHTQIK